MSVVLLLTVNNLILNIGIAGKEGANNLSAELLLQMHTGFIVRTLIKSIKAKERSKNQERMVDIYYSGELFSQEIHFYMRGWDRKIYRIFQFSRSH